MQQDPDREQDVVHVSVGRFAPVVERGLVAMLGDDPLVRVLASDLEFALLAEMVTQKVVPDVVVVSEPSQISALTRLRTKRPATGIIVFAHDPQPEYAMRILSAGATCVDRSASATDVLNAVRVAARGGRIFVAPTGAQVERPFPSDAPPLTKRELEVLRYVSERTPYARIATALGISVETVRKHVARIRTKLGVASTQELFEITVPTTL